MEQSLVDQSERFVVQNSNMGGVSGGSGGTDLYGTQYTDSTGEIIEKLQYIKHKTMETADILRRMEQEQEAFALKCHDRQKLEGIIHLHRMQQQQGNVQQNAMQVQALEKNFAEQKQRLEYELKQRVSESYMGSYYYSANTLLSQHVCVRCEPRMGLNASVSGRPGYLCARTYHVYISCVYT